MMRTKALALAVGLALLTMVQPPAALAAPGDTVEDPIPIAGGLPFDFEYDTSTATARFADPCWDGSGLGAVRFYSFTTETDTLITIGQEHVDGSVVALRVVDGGLEPVSSTRCGPVQLPAGEDYVLAVGTVVFLEGPMEVSGQSGTLHFDFVPPPMEVSVTLTGATVDKATGTVTARGTMSCNSIGETYGLSVEVRQATGSRREPNVGARAVNGDCGPGRADEWSVTVDAPRPFRPGTSLVSVEGVACNIIATCDSDAIGPIRTSLRPRR